MRVLHVIDHLGLGGAQSALLDLLEARSPAVQASVLVLRDRDLAGIPERLAAAQVPLLRAGLSAGAPAGLGHLWRAISAAEIVHTHLEVSCHLAGSMVLARGRRRPLLVIQTDNDPHHYTAPHRLMARALGPHADAHVVLGPSIAEALRQLVGRQLLRIAVIPLGIRPDRFSREYATATRFSACARALHSSSVRSAGWPLRKTLEPFWKLFGSWRRDSLVCAC